MPDSSAGVNNSRDFQQKTFPFSDHFHRHTALGLALAMHFAAQCVRLFCSVMTTITLNGAPPFFPLTSCCKESISECIQSHGYIKRYTHGIHQEGSFITTDRGEQTDCTLKSLDFGS